MEKYTNDEEEDPTDTKKKINTDDKEEHLAEQLPDEI